MNKKSSRLILILLILYGVALAGVSWYVFSPAKKAVVQPKLPAIVDSAAVKIVGSSDGKVYLNTGREKINVVQIVLIFPYRSDLGTLKAEILPKNLTVVQNKVSFDKNQNKIILAIGAYAQNGFQLPTESLFLSLTVNGKPLVGVKPSLDYNLSRMISLDKGINLPLIFN